MPFLKNIVLFFFCIFLLSVSAQPKDVDSTLINIETINSEQDDYQPFVVGKRLLMFTSTRKSTPETQTTEYTEKIYWARQRSKQKWSIPEKNGYSWHSDNNTALVGMAPKHFFFYRAYWDGNGEIFYAKRQGKGSQVWQADKLRKFTAVCTDFDENSITAGMGDTLFFSSNRCGSYDIFMLTGGNKITPIDALNTTANETDVFFSPHNSRLWFASDRAGGAGGYDIYWSELRNRRFSVPVRLPDTLINTPFDDRDFHPYNDTLLYFASNRPGGLGGYDIYELEIKSKKTASKDTLTEEEKEEEHIVSQKEQLYKKLDELGLLPFHGEVQIGVYRYIKSLKAFQKRFPCIVRENVRMDKHVIDGTAVHKYIIDTVYTDVDAAVSRQIAIERLHCLPEEWFGDMPFVAILDKKGNRFAIFWKKEEFSDKNIFYILKNGEQVWKAKRF